MAEIPTADALDGFSLESVCLVAASTRELRFRVEDPIVYPAHQPFELVFAEPAFFAGPLSFDSVSLRISAEPPRLPSGEDLPNGHVYDFVAAEIVPTDGRPYQVRVLPDGQSHVRFGKTLHSITARVIASSVMVAIAEATEAET